MQIYKTKQEIRSGESDYISEIIDNDFSLKQKIDLLVSSYQRLRLDPNGFSELIKGLCAKLGLQARFPRKGDVNERFDVIFNTKDDHKIVAEIEIPSTAILDAPRNLLDDIAIMINRNNIEATKLTPLVICWDLPNNRTDYWNVVKDINDVLNIQINTCTILSLAILVWTNTPLDLKSGSYYLTPGKNKLEIIIRILTENDIDLAEYKGFLYPTK